MPQLSLRACLITDGPAGARWQVEAVRKAMAQGLQISCVLTCTNTTTPRKPGKHALYYALRLTSMRHEWTLPQPWASIIPADVPVVRFASEWEGAWQRIPTDAQAAIRDHGCDVVLKFGMYLLRDPQDLPAPLGVLSFHHGDPSQYRGRPAGFYELLHGTECLGVMVQRLSNRLDGGDVLAFGRTKAHLHSYRQTLRSSYSASVHLLVKALRAAADGQTVDLGTDGPNYRLPSNRTVLRFVSVLGRRKVERVLYGATTQKRWQVAFGPRLDIRTGGLLETWPLQVLTTPHGYEFLADPLPGAEGEILAEALSTRSGLGELVIIDPDGNSVPLDTSSLGVGHFSYPFLAPGAPPTLLPEMAGIGPQRMAALGPDRHLSTSVPLVGLEKVRLVDPTLFYSNDTWWLFAGQPGSASELLFLWGAPSLAGRYAEHPDSPIVIDPSCARPAGPVMEIDGSVYRFGQDNRRRYGDGIKVQRIESLSWDKYAETPWAEVRVRDAHGPHTLVLEPERSVFDFYDERMSFRAALLRIRNRMNGRSRRSA